MWGHRAAWSPLWWWPCWKLSRYWKPNSLQISDAAPNGRQRHDDASFQSKISTSSEWASVPPNLLGEKSIQIYYITDKVAEFVIKNSLLYKTHQIGQYYFYFWITDTVKLQDSAFVYQKRWFFILVTFLNVKRVDCDQNGTWKLHVTFGNRVVTNLWILTYEL